MSFRSSTASVSARCSRRRSRRCAWGSGRSSSSSASPGSGSHVWPRSCGRTAQTWSSLTLRCEQYESSTPYHVFRSFFRSLLDVPLTDAGAANRAALGERLRKVDEELVPWVPLLGAPLDAEVESTPEVDDLDPSFRRARLHGVLGSLLGRLLDSPTLLLFEDVHWMDDASTELLRHLGTQLPTRPWLTCTTRRPGEGGFLAAEGTPPLPAHDAPARTASPGRREVADSGCRRRPRAFGGGVGRDLRQRRWQPAFPPRARGSGGGERDRGAAAGHGRGARRYAYRPARSCRPRAPALGFGSRYVVLRCGDRRRARR